MRVYWSTHQQEYTEIWLDAVDLTDEQRDVICTVLLDEIYDHLGDRGRVYHTMVLGDEIIRIKITVGV